MFRENRVCGFSIDGALRQPQAVLDWRRHPVGKVRPGGRAAGRADIRIVIRNAVGVFGTAKRAARCPVADPPTGPPTLPQRLRGRLGQPVARRGLTTVRTVKPEEALELGDARGLDGNRGIAVREGCRQSRDPVGQCLKIVNHS